MPACAIAGCTSYSRKTKGTSISYHSFPKDVRIQKIWISKCRRKDVFNIATSTICSLHFTSDSYVRDLRAELLNLPPKKLLKPDAVPQMNLPGCAHADIGASSSNRISTNNDQMTDNLPSREKRHHARDVRKRALERLAEVSSKKITVEKSTSTEPCLNETDELQKLRKQINELKDKNHKLSLICSSLKNQFIQHKTQLNLVNKKFVQQNESLKKAVKSEVERILGKLFSKNQLKFLRGGKRVKWCQEDISKAMTMCAISKKAYIYLRGTWGFPLPALSTLRKWTSTSTFHGQSGIPTEVQLTKAPANTISSVEHVCVLSFDEINADSNVTYDQNGDCVVGSP